MNKFSKRIKDVLFKKISLNNTLFLVIIFIFAIIVITFIFFHYFNIFSLSDFIIVTGNSKAEWGQFGDFVGGTLNPLLSFLGLIALLVTIALQSKELELSRIELKLTRKELKKSAAAQNEIKKTQIKQQFENTFFALLEQHNRILERLLKEPAYSKDIPFPNNYDDIPDEERKFIEETPIEKTYYLEALIEKLANIGDITIIERSVRINFRNVFHSEDINMFGKKISKDYKNKLYGANLIIKEREKCGYYFRFLYQLLKFIATNIPSEISPFDEIRKGNQPPLALNEKMYSNIVRSSLTNDITLLLAINCYCQDESDDFWIFKLLIERYAFFEHVSSKIGWAIWLNREIKGTMTNQHLVIIH